MNIDVKVLPAGGTLLAEPPEIARVGVIGAGQMGNGIAHVCALAGLPVTMLDVKPPALDRAMGTITRNMDRQVNRKLISVEDKEDALARIRATTDYADLGDADLVIEAATEKEDVKHAIFRALTPHLQPTCLLASNTSSISITKLVEIIRGIATDEATFQVVHNLAEKLGKTPTVAEDFPAFIVNRILVPMINEAVYALYEGVGSVSGIDVSMRLGANHPMGPLELADFIGLDTCLSIMQVLYEGLSDSKYRPCPLLVKYVEAGWLGRKTNRGFYDYTVTPPRPTR
jgi:3-hydroxybutyryl-CoA dehydrogenase